VQLFSELESVEKLTLRIDKELMAYCACDAEGWRHFQTLLYARHMQHTWCILVLCEQAAPWGVINIRSYTETVL
jgi:hypothetical protein